MGVDQREGLPEPDKQMLFKVLRICRYGLEMKSFQVCAYTLFVGRIEIKANSEKGKNL